MRAESALIGEVAEDPGDRQHANKGDNSDNADGNVAFADRRGIRLASLARARRRHRAGETNRDWLYQLEQCPDRGNADRARAEETHFVTPGRLRECSGSGRQVTGECGEVWHAPAPANACANEHGDADGKST